MKETLKPSPETDGEHLYGVCRARGSHRMASGHFVANLTQKVPLEIVPALLCLDCPRVEVKGRGVFERPPA